MAVRRAQFAKDRIRAFLGAVILVAMLAWPIASGRTTSEPLAPSRLAVAPPAVQAQDEPAVGTRAFLPAAYRSAYLRDEPPAWRFIERTRFNDIAVDEASGAVWTSTNDGVHRYSLSDGSMAPFAVDGRGPTSAMGAVAVDGAGNVWFAARPLYADGDADMTAGVVRLSPDGAQRRFTTADGLAHDAIYAMAAGDDGSMWFGTFRGASRRAADGTWTTYRFRPDEVGCDFDCFDVVLSVAPDGHGGVWFGRSTGLTSVSIDGLRGHHSAGREIRAIAVDSSGSVWHAVDDRRIVRRDRELHDVSVSTVLPDRNYGPIFDVAIDARDRLWVAAEQGVWRVGADGIWHAFSLALDHTKRATAIALDDNRRQRAWIGRAGALTRVSDDGNHSLLGYFGPELSGESVTALTRSEDGVTWLGFEPETDGPLHAQVVRFGVGGYWQGFWPGVVQGERRARISGFAALPDGSAWASTGTQMARFGPAGDGADYFAASSFLDGAFLGPPSVDGDGTVWFGLPNNDTPPGGVVALTRTFADFGTWLRFTTADGLFSDNVHAVLLDPARRTIWALGEGLSVREPDGAWHSAGASDAIQSEVYEAGLIDRSGNRWFAGNGVVAVLDAAGAWRVEEVQGSLEWLAQAIAEDSSGRVWLGTHRGLLRREPNGSWQTIPVPAGSTLGETMGWNSINALVALPNGELWAATRRGIAILRTDSLVGR